MAINQVPSKQMGWHVADKYMSAARAISFALGFHELADLSQPQSIDVTLNGSPLGVQITGDPFQVESDLSGLSDQTFLSAQIKCEYAKSEQKLTVNVNFHTGMISLNAQGFSSEEWLSLYNYSREIFPSKIGPEKQELSRMESQLRALLRLAAEIEGRSKESKRIVDYLSEIVRSAEEAYKGSLEDRKNISKLLEAVTTNAEEVQGFRSTVNNLLIEVRTDREAISEARERVQIMEADANTTINELSSLRDGMQSFYDAAKESVTKLEIASKDIVSRNESLQGEIKEHLLKAVGASLFSAFETRNKNIAFSKWIWASVAGGFIVVQTLLLGWIASLALNLDNGIAFYSEPAFLLRALMSVPILLFIGYAISQYAKEREIEELYGFKSVISYSLSPYIDLISRLSSDPQQQKAHEFVVNAVGQIFENPLEKMQQEPKKAELSGVKDILDKLIKVLEAPNKK